MGKKLTRKRYTYTLHTRPIDVLLQCVPHRFFFASEWNLIYFCRVFSTLNFSMTIQVVGDLMKVNERNYVFCARFKCSILTHTHTQLAFQYCCLNPKTKIGTNHTEMHTMNKIKWSGFRKPITFRFRHKHFFLSFPSIFRFAHTQTHTSITSAKSIIQFTKCYHEMNNQQQLATA